MAEYQELSVSKRLQLVEEIWNSIALDCKDLPVTDKQKIELTHRLDRLERQGTDDIDARHYLAELASKL